MLTPTKLMKNQLLHIYHHYMKYFRNHHVYILFMILLVKIKNYISSH